jgi:hypothetical protein
LVPDIAVTPKASEVLILLSEEIELIAKAAPAPVKFQVVLSDMPAQELPALSKKEPEEALT